MKRQAETQFPEPEKKMKTETSLQDLLACRETETCLQDFLACRDSLVHCVLKYLSLKDKQNLRLSCSVVSKRCLSYMFLHCKISLREVTSFPNNIQFLSVSHIKTEEPMVFHEGLIELSLSYCSIRNLVLPASLQKLKLDCVQLSKIESWPEALTELSLIDFDFEELSPKFPDSIQELTIKDMKNRPLYNLPLDEPWPASLQTFETTHMGLLKNLPLGLENVVLKGESPPEMLKELPASVKFLYLYYPHGSLVGLPPALERLFIGKYHHELPDKKDLPATLDKIDISWHRPPQARPGRHLNEFQKLAKLYGIRWASSVIKRRTKTPPVMKYRRKYNQ